MDSDPAQLTQAWPFDLGRAKNHQPIDFKDNAHAYQDRFGTGVAFERTDQGDYF